MVWAGRKMFMLWVVLFLITSAVSAQAMDEKITVFTEEWAPYNYSENGELKGISIEVLRAVIDKLEADVEFKLYPSMRSSKLMKEGPNTMFVSMFRTPEREEKFQWIGPLIDASIYFYKRKSDVRVITSLEEAKKVESIASRHAGLVHERLISEGFDNLDDTGRNAVEVYKKLLAGRCDLAISDAPLGVKHILKNLGQPTDILTQLPMKLVDQQLYIAVHKQVSPERVKRWQKALEELQKTDHYNEIIEKYSGEV